MNELQFQKFESFALIFSKASLHLKEHLNAPFYSAKQNYIIQFSTKMEDSCEELLISSVMPQFSPPSSYDLTLFHLTSLPPDCSPA